MISLRLPQKTTKKNTQEQGKPKPSHLMTLDAVRGAAALYVVCHHARILLLLSLADSHAVHLGLLNRLLLNFFSIFVFGHQAVVLFFVLSGFCIHYRQAQLLQKSNKIVFDVRDYFKRRFIRIAPPYYAAIAFTAGIDWVTRLVNAPLVLHGTDNLYANFLIFQYLDMRTLLGNLLFVQSFLIMPFGNDTPLWSLAYEFYLYALYPLYLVIRKWSGLPRTAAVILATSACAIGAARLHLVQANSIFWFLSVFEYWFCWVLGAITAEIYINKNETLPKWIQDGRVTLIFGLLWLASVRIIPNVAISDTIGGLICAQFLLVVLRPAMAQAQAMKKNFVSLLSTVGDFSYSLYLIHVPILALVCAIWLRYHSQVPSSPWLFFVGVICSVAIGRLSYWLVEKRVLDMRQKAIPPATVVQERGEPINTSIAKDAAL